MSELLSEVAARSFDKLTAEMKEAREGSGDTPEARYVSVSQTYVNFARAHPARFRLMFRWDALSLDNPALLQAARRTFAEMVNSITAQRGQPEVTPESLATRIRDRSLQNDVLIGWSHIHGYAQLFLEGQFDGFAAEEGADVFIERTLKHGGQRLSHLFREEG